MAGFLRSTGGITVFSALKLLKRSLHLHEYQCKGLMHPFGINVQDFRVVDNKDQLKNFNAPFAEYVIKAQVLAGGRGKGVFKNGFKGGVHVTKSIEDARSIADKMLGQCLVTKQTGKDGVVVKKVMIADAVKICKEFYVAILLDSDYGGPVLIGSPMGGMDIEEVVEKMPHTLLKIPFDIEKGLTEECASKMVNFLEVEAKIHKQAVDQLKNMCNLFLKADLLQLEVNPLSVTDDLKVIAVDSKMTFDDNAKFRNISIFEMEDTSQIDHLELMATENNLNYVPMDGDIGCIVNGAGLAMATMDMVKYCGGEPANFLDLGGGVSVQGVLAAMDILARDIKVKKVFINIFGGIVDCKIVAQGLIQACLDGNKYPDITVRLQGTNCKEAKEIIDASNLQNIHMYQDFHEAALAVCSKL